MNRYLKTIICLLVATNFLYEKRGMCDDEKNPENNVNQTFVKAAALAETTDRDAINNPGIVGSNVYCKFQLNAYDCKNGGIAGRFYFDIDLQNCKTGDAGKCEWNDLNSFDSMNTCRDSCKESGISRITDDLGPKVYCRLQPDFGGCHEYHPRWYYDMTERRCKGFSFSGCGGNLNRFSSYQACASVCLPLINYD